MYFQVKIAENPSFQYALQMNREEQIANIFWVDAKMLTDYIYFGDVFGFDTTFGANKESKPFLCICWVQSVQGDSGFWCCSQVR